MSAGMEPAGGDPAATASPWQTPANPGPSWNVPRIALPGCMGVLSQYQTEWWYYVGWARSAAGEEFSLQFQCLRAGLQWEGVEFQAVAAPVGIGTRSTGAYLWAPGYGLGVGPSPGPLNSLTVLPAGDDQYGVHLRPVLGSEVAIAYTGGEPVGTRGSIYRIAASGSSAEGTPFSAGLCCVDQRGLVLEGESGYVGPRMTGEGGGGLGTGSYEFAQPLLSVTGGTLQLEGTAHALVEGWLWCDRQALTNPPPPRAVDGARPDQAFAGQKPLYRGGWLGIALDGGVTMALATFWQPPDAGGLQWITGSAVGRPPFGGFGTVYLPLGGDRLGRNGGEPIRGAGRSDAWDFDINLLEPGLQSPHWKSQASGHTYSTAWRLSFHPRLEAFGVPSTLVLRALVDGCENLLPDAGNAFWEGAATVQTEDGRPAGHAFVEQMGFN